MRGIRILFIAAILAVIETYLHFVDVMQIYQRQIPAVHRCVIN